MAWQTCGTSQTCLYHFKKIQGRPAKVVDVFDRGNWEALEAGILAITSKESGDVKIKYGLKNTYYLLIKSCERGGDLDW